MKTKIPVSYYYIFDCVGCWQFYGEQKPNENGELLCPVCLTPESIESPFVERVAVVNA